MQRYFLFLILVLLSGLLLAGCGGDANAPAGAPTATVVGSENYWNLVQQAQDAYKSASYARALELARAAITLDPQENTAWETYRQADIALVADDYLTNLPAHRYRLPVDRFVQDEVNHAKDWFVIDIREPDEFAAGHIEGAIDIPLRELLHHLDELPNSRTAPILIYCHSQKRSTHAMLILHELGYSKAFHLEGGYAAYADWMNNNPLPTPGPTPTPGPEEPDYGC
jgi:rhodanese-related sulfurtransferase